MKHCSILVLVLLLALALRLYPTLVSGMPFSTDGWGPIRNAEIIVAHSPIDLRNETLFDGYHNYWPAVSVFGAFLSLITGLRPIAAMSIGVPIIAALTVLIFYALVKRFGGNRGLALLSTLMLTVVYPFALFTAGVTKETYATPLYLTAILLFLGYGKIREIFLFIVASIALVFAHHLAALTTAAVIFSVALGGALNNFRMGESVKKSSFIPAAALASAVALYLKFYVYNGLFAKAALTSSDFISAFLYQAVLFGAALYFTYGKPKQQSFKSAFKCIAISILVLLSVVLCTRRAIIPGAPILPTRYLGYATPFVVSAPLTVLGAGEILRGKKLCYLTLAFWISVLLGVEGYAIFGSPPVGFSLAYRVVNLITVPAAVLCAAGLYSLALGFHGSLGGLRRIVASALLLVIVASNVYDLYASVSLGERYMGYFWKYTQAEFSAGEWLSENACWTVAGDVKVYYLLGEYFGLEVDTVQALKYFYGEASKHPSLFMVHGSMVENGYVFYGGYSVDLPSGWTERIAGLSQIYSNGFVKVYMG